MKFIELGKVDSDTFIVSTLESQPSESAWLKTGIELFRGSHTKVWEKIAQLEKDGFKLLAPPLKWTRPIK